MGKRESRKKDKRTGAPPQESAFLKKKREQRLGLRPTVNDLQPDTSPASRPAFQAASTPQRSGNAPSPGKTIVTEAYRGAGSEPSLLVGQYFPAETNPALAGKPCFFAATKENGRWYVTRYVGDIGADGSFRGNKQAKDVGDAAYETRRLIFKDFVEWVRTQNPAYLVSGPNPLFGQAQKIYARRPDHTPKAAGPS